MIRHRHRLGEALGLVVDATRPNRVHIAPVRLGLGMLQWVAVDLRRRRKQVPGPLGLGQT